MPASTPRPGIERFQAWNTANGTRSCGQEAKPVAEALRPRRGGFLRPFGCGQFIRDFLTGKGLYGSPMIDPDAGAPQADIFHHYKETLLQAIALDRATREEERQARLEKRPISPEEIEKLTVKHLARIPYKTSSCCYHSFVVYFSNLQRLGWVEFTGREEPSAFQDHYLPGPPRRYYRLTAAGWAASDAAWSNPLNALYG
jgi:hypothetical protein